ncbi:unnamed protein product [Blepharisma stoltei]|uniref:Uncharacterized protein n=1 Tax=Blepharisma stoltei TaxID=1481888 RepID=A0AAU9KA92_9CILI|nr:unnamed protein product [Blepharisma stoltei]
MDSLIIYLTISLMVAQATGPFINSVKELYFTIKKTLAENSHPKPIKAQQKSKKIDLNNLNDFFDGAAGTNMEETENNSSESIK